MSALTFLPFLPLAAIFELPNTTNKGLTHPETFNTFFFTVSSTWTIPKTSSKRTKYAGTILSLTGELYVKLKTLQEFRTLP